MITKEQAFKEFESYESARDEFYALLDACIPFKKNSNSYDFERAAPLDPKAVYEAFFKLDYQARKVRGVGVNLAREKWNDGPNLK
ncbi:MAG: hypothetical protein ACTTIC_05645 [Helicobacteraceae bacterium]